MGDPCEYIYTSYWLCIQDREKYTSAWKYSLLWTAMCRFDSCENRLVNRDAITAHLRLQYFFTPWAVSRRHIHTDRKTPTAKHKAITHWYRKGGWERKHMEDLNKPKALLSAEFEHILPYLKTLGQIQSEVLSFNVQITQYVPTYLWNFQSSITSSLNHL